MNKDNDMTFAHSETKLSGWLRYACWTVHMVLVYIHPVF